VKDIFVYGTGGHARVLADLIKSLSGYKLCGFITQEDTPSGQLLGVPLISEKSFQIKEGTALALGIGDNAARAEVYTKIKNVVPNAFFPSLIHKSAIIAPDAKIEEGAVCMAGSIVQSGSHLGIQCLVNTGAQVDHDAKVGKFSSVGPKAALGGNVSIGDYSSIGMGALVKHGIKIGSDCVIGMGSVVVKDIDSNAMAYGTPCKVIGHRKREDRYL